MKKIILCVVVVALCVGGFAHAKTPMRGKFKGSPDEPFPGYSAKLDKHAKDIWKKWKKADANTDSMEVELIIKTNAPVKKVEKRLFKKIGFKYRSIIRSSETASIMTGRIVVKNLQCLAAMEFVEYIEAAKPLLIK